MGAEHPSPENERHEDHIPLLEAKQRRETHIIPVTLDGASPGRFNFNAAPRPWRDTLFSFVFFATVLTSYAIGFFAVRNADAHPESKLRFARYNPESKQCEPIQHAYVGTTPTHVALFPERKAYETGRHTNEGAILAPVFTTAALILPMGFSLLYLLHRYTRAILFAILALMCIIPVAFALVASSICLTSHTCSVMSTSERLTSAFLCFAAFVTFLQFLVVCKNRNRLDLTVQILKTSLQALKENFSLLALNPMLGLATVVINTPIVVFMWYALLNGRVAPNYEAIRDGANGCSQATGAPCCYFKRSEWVTPYLILTGVAVLWVVLVAGQLQILVVSGAISQWYFAPSGSSTAGATKRSMRNAFGPSFGTACLSSLMLTVSMVLKSVMDRAVVKTGPSIVTVLLRACFAWLFYLFEFFTRFSTNFAAITGDGFCSAAHATSELLRRNWLSTLIVEVLVQYLLTGMALSLALLHFGVVFASMYYFTAMEPFWSLMTANVCFLIALLGLGLLYQAMAAVIDTVYICYAMDKDGSVVSKAEVHNVYMLLPPASSGDETMLAVRSFEP